MFGRQTNTHKICLCFQLQLPLAPNYFRGLGLYIPYLSCTKCYEVIRFFFCVVSIRSLAVTLFDSCLEVLVHYG